MVPSEITELVPITPWSFQASKWHMAPITILDVMDLIHTGYMVDAEG